MLRRFPPGWLVILLLLLAGGLWLVMVMGPLAKLTAYAGGLQPFDLRPFGYSQAEAIAFMAAIGDGARNYYVNFQIKLFDTPFVAINALAQMAALWWLTKPGRIALPSVGRIILVVLPIVGAWFDYAENGALREVLRAGAEVTEAMVASASTMTVLKSAMQTLIDVLIVVFAGIVFGRWLRSRRAANA